MVEILLVLFLTGDDNDEDEDEVGLKGYKSKMRKQNRVQMSKVLLILLGHTQGDKIIKKDQLFFFLFYFILFLFTFGETDF